MALRKVSAILSKQLSYFISIWRVQRLFSPYTTSHDFAHRTDSPASGRLPPSSTTPITSSLNSSFFSSSSKPKNPASSQSFAKDDIRCNNDPDPLGTQSHIHPLSAHHRQAYLLITAVPMLLPTTIVALSHTIVFVSELRTAANAADVDTPSDGEEEEEEGDCESLRGEDEGLFRRRSRGAQVRQKCFRGPSTFSCKEYEGKILSA